MNSKCTTIPAFRRRAFFPSSRFLVVLFGSGSGGIRSTVLTLEADGLVGPQVS